MSELGSHYSDSALISAVLSVSDGQRDLDQTIAALPEHSAAEVIYAVNQLVSQGILERGDTPFVTDSGRTHFCETLGPVRLISDTAVALEAMQDALRDVQLPDTPFLRGLDVVLCSDFLGFLASKVASESAAWLPVKLVGQRSYFGPMFGPGIGSCFSCLQERLRLNRPIETALLDQTSFFSSPLHRLGIAPGAAETIRAVVEMLSGDPEGLRELAGVTEVGTEGRRVHEFPCRCQADALETARPLDLSAETSAPRHLGGFRTRSPEQTTARLGPVVSNLTGLISSVGPLMPDAASAVSRRYIWAAAYPVVPREKDPPADAFNGVSMGKGLTLEQAQASALCEAVERLSAQCPADLETVKGTLDDLHQSAIDPGAVWQFSKSQHLNRDAWNALSSDDRRHVPEVIRSDAQLDWVPVWSLSEQCQKWMLRDLCFANTPEPRVGRFDPNGCAAGASRQEATVQALLELVERDSVAIWWYNRAPRPGLDPLQSSDSRVRELARGFLDQGWDCWLLDLTGDLNIPCLAALARSSADGRWCIGFGCHFDHAIAIERAMTELAQLFRADGRDGPPPWDAKPEDDEAYLFPSGQAALSDAPVTGHETFEGLISWTVDQLKKRGMETLLLNQTQHDCGLAVVKVFVPGLCHFWPRFGARRIYNVPVQLGWRQNPLSEKQLNPTHLFL